MSVLHIVQFEFLLYNVLHSVGNIYWWMFAKGNPTPNQIKQM